MAFFKRTKPEPKNPPTWGEILGKQWEDRRNHASHCDCSECTAYARSQRDADQ